MQRTQSIAALAFGYFVVGTGAFVVTGLLNEIANDVGTSVAGAGQLMSAYSLALAVGAPLLTPLTTRFDRRTLITSGLVLFGLLHFAAAAAPSYGALVAARVFLGVTAAVVTTHLVAGAGLAAPPGQSGKAVATMFLGFTFSIVVGVPLGNLLGATLGWRAALVLVGVISLASAIWVAVAVSAKLPNTPVDRNAWRTLVATPAIIWILLTTLLQCAGQFTLYTYLAPSLAAGLGADATGIGLLFGWFGVSGLIGNFIATRVIDRVGPGHVVAVCLLLITAAFVAWPLASGSRMLTTLVILIWGLGGFAIHPAQQARLVAIAPNLASASAALNLSGTYLGQMLGGVFGGVLISWFDMNALAWGGAALLAGAGGATFAAGRVRARAS